MQRRHQQSSRSSLTGHVTQRDHESPIFALDEVVVITADLVTGKTDALQFITIHMRRRRRLKALLNLTRQRELAFKTLTLESRLNQPRILDAYGGDRRERSQNFQVIFREAPFGDG